MTNEQPNTPGGGWEEGRVPAPLPDPRPGDGVREPPDEPVPAEGDYGSLDLPAEHPVEPTPEPAF